MTTTQEQHPMSAIARDVIHFFTTSEFPAGLARKVLNTFTANRELPETLMHAGKSYPVRELFYDWLKTKTPQN